MSASIEIPRRNDRALGITLAVATVGLGVAPLLGLPSFLQSLVIEILVFSILAMSLDLLVGYTGLVSFGHAAFFAIAGYGTAIAARATPEILITLPVGLLAAIVLALVVGWLSIRLSGFYFLMITFAFAQMIYVAAIRLKPLTGGSDGLIVASPTLLGTPVLGSRESLYWFTLAMFVACCLAMHRIVRSELGRTLVGIRENTPRMRALGYDVRRYKLIAFVIAAFLAGIAGVVNVLFNLFIAPESAHWTQSALALVMVLIGGSTYLAGPIVGAGIVLLLQHWLSSYTEYWGLILGLLFIALISGAREGLCGIVAGIWSRRAR